ncbi:hypothetical protein [Aquiflexum lacus]|uniref:hypothetical protein n=1 Tax=Aquiflexum lacus TaxID=2483805 RepID=UPI00189366C0|nr:hypothetical protein [Aquiflexum lacus]
MTYNPNKFKKLFSIFLVLFWTCLEIFAQRPITSGPNPLSTTPPDDDFPFLIVAGGAVVAAGSFLTVKKFRAPKIFVVEHLPTYLLNRNFLPNQDALNLMYGLNPELDSGDVIRSNKKLRMPSFPEPPPGINFQEILSAQIDFNKDSLRNLENNLKSTIQKYKAWEVDLRKTEDLKSANRISAILPSFEAINTVALAEKSEENIVMIQFFSDLIFALNDNLEKIIHSQSISDEQVNLIENLDTNLKDLLTSFDPNTLNEVNDLTFNDLIRNQIQFASTFSFQENYQSDKNINIEGFHKNNVRLNSSKLKEFAFAVYKFGEQGELITEGPEVEKKYLIKYSLPALKDNPDSFHYLSGPATYAIALLPPAKLFFVLEDHLGSSIPINNSLIDFKLAFNNPKLGDPEDRITVPIYVSK